MLPCQMQLLSSKDGVHSVYMYTYIYVCIHIHIYTCICLCVCVFTCMFIYMYLYVHMYIYIHVSICTHVFRVVPHGAAIHTCCWAAMQTATKYHVTRHLLLSWTDQAVILHVILHGILHTSLASSQCCDVMCSMRTATYNVCRQSHHEVSQTAAI